MIIKTHKQVLKMENNKKKDISNSSTPREKLTADLQCQIMNMVKNRRQKQNESYTKIYCDLVIKLGNADWDNKIKNQYKKIIQYCDCNNQDIDAELLQEIPFTVMKRVANEIKKKINVQELEKFKQKMGFIFKCVDLLFENLN